MALPWAGMWSDLQSSKTQITASDFNRKWTGMDVNGSTAMAHREDGIGGILLPSIPVHSRLHFELLW
jgi:hypothetical protein